jgi:hypothetical protein
MSDTAIQRVAEALATRLEDNGNHSVYVGPLDDPDARNANLVLFLFRVAVHGDLRNTEHIVPGALPTDPPVVYRDALALELHFLLTVGGSADAGEPGSLGTLGRAMQLLNGAPILSGISVDGQTVRVTLASVSSEEMSRVWTLFPTANYRTSVIYVASPVWIDPELPPADAEPVIGEQYTLEPIEPSTV